MSVPDVLRHLSLFKEERLDRMTSTPRWKHEAARNMAASAKLRASAARP